MYHSIRVFVYGFIIILVIMIALAVLAFNTNNNADTSANQAVTNQLEKMNLTQEMSLTVRNRSQFIQSILLQISPSFEASNWDILEKLNRNYAEIHAQLLPILNARERENLQQIDKLNSEISKLHDHVAVLFLNGSQREATHVLLEEVLPLTEPLLNKLSGLVTMQRDNARQVLLLAGETAEANRLRFMLYAIFSILISLIVASLAVFYGKKLSSQLDEMTDYLEARVSERTESLLDVQKELLEDNTELARLASTDALTELSNRNHMGEILKKEHSRFRRNGHCFGIIMIDIDHFKLVNDTHGHDVGDQVLMQMARYLESAVRISDYTSRWGGEEFLICCTAIKADDVRLIAENVRNTIAKAEFVTIDHLTISLGCAIIQPGESIDELIKRADVALYEAKHLGRNQTVVSEA